MYSRPSTRTIMTTPELLILDLPLCRSACSSVSNSKINSERSRESSELRLETVWTRAVAEPLPWSSRRGSAPHAHAPEQSP
jgi:hypothetical protein